MPKIQDFGEKIGGAKKDLWRSRGLQDEDIDEMQQREYSLYVTKDNVWPIPDYVDLVKNGMSPACAYFYKGFRTSFPNKIPENSTEEMAKKYTMALKDAKAICESLKDDYDIQSVYKNFFYGCNYVKNYSVTDRGTHNPAITNKSIKYAHKFTYDYDFKALVSEAKIQDFPNNFSSELKNTRISHFTDGTYALVKDSIILKGNFKTPEEVYAYAKSLRETTKDKPTKPRGGSLQVVRPQFKNMERTGPKYATKEQMTGEDLLNTFGFRGGEFGNWNSDADRQACLNYAYEACCDLARVLNFPLKGLAKCGDSQALAIAFGARGSGRAAAHFEPARTVMNLTKMHGAGSFAHEFGHYLDHSLGRFFNSSHGLSEIIVTSAMRSKNENLVTAMASVKSAIKNRPMTKQDFLELTAERLMTKQKFIFQKISYFTSKLADNSDPNFATCFAIKNQIDKNVLWDDATREKVMAFKKIISQIEMFNTTSSYDLFDFDISEYLKELDKYTNFSEKCIQGQTVTTNYVKCAQNLDEHSSKAYFSTYIELFARAFESYVQDTLPYKSYYLVYGTQNSFYGDLNPYPADEERLKINAAMANLCNVIRQELFNNQGCELGNVSVPTQEKPQKSKESSAVENKQPIPKKITEQPITNTTTEKPTSKKQMEQPQTNTSKKPNYDFENLNEFRNAVGSVKTWAMPKATIETNIRALKMRIKQMGYVTQETPLKDSETIGKSKAWRVVQKVIYLNSNSTPEKKLQGLIEVYIQLKAYFLKGAQSYPMIMQGGIYALCKAMDLDVRTYCKGDKFEQFIHNPDKCKKYIACLSKYFESTVPKKDE